MPGGQSCSGAAPPVVHSPFSIIHSFFREVIMNAELIAVGTEILLGDIVNTDAQVISQGLSELGINVFYQTVVGDHHAGLRQVV